MIGSSAVTSPATSTSSTGYGQTRPLYPDADPRALAGNRRVDLVVASPSSDAVKALLPQVAAGTPSTGPEEVQPPAADSAPAEAPAAAAVVDPGLARPVEVAQVSTTEHTAEQAVAEHADTTPEGH